jgi:hypothetical protein
MQARSTNVAAAAFCGSINTLCNKQQPAVKQGISQHPDLIPMMHANHAYATVLHYCSIRTPRHPTNCPYPSIILP